MVARALASDQILNVVRLEVGLDFGLWLIGNSDDGQAALLELLVKLIEMRDLAFTGASPRGPLLD
jgi:hypothetical protein